MAAPTFPQKLPVKGRLFLFWPPGWHLAPAQAACGWRLAAFVLMATRLACAQDSLRNSMTGDAAAAASRLQQSPQLYTFKAGDFSLLAVPSFEVDWNDNVNLSKTDAQSDFILEPFLQLTGRYPLTQRNVLSLSIGVGYYDYLRFSTNSGLRMSSDSQISFDMYIKDFLINFHDRFSLTEDPSTEPAVAQTANFGSFINTVGLTTIWDLEDVVLTAGYDHQNYLSVAGQFDYLNHSSELPVVRAGLRLRPDLTAGVEATAGYTTYDQSVLNDNVSYSAGLYADWKPSSSLHVQPRAGLTIYQFQNTSQSAQVYYFGSPPSSLADQSIRTSDVSSWYADLTVAHQITKAISYGFSAGHEIRLGIESDLVDDYYFRPNVNWTIFKDVSLNPSFFYEHGHQGFGNVTGNLVETYSWYGGGFTANYPLMKRLLLSLTYRFTVRSSDILTDSYTQNLVGLRLAYQLP
jgi:hypothetical protein